FPRNDPPDAAPMDRPPKFPPPELPPRNAPPPPPPMWPPLNPPPPPWPPPPNPPPPWPPPPPCPPPPPPPRASVMPGALIKIAASNAALTEIIRLHMIHPPGKFSAPAMSLTAVIFRKSRPFSRIFRERHEGDRHIGRIT